MKQGYNDRMDDSLGNRDGKKSSKEQNYKDRRDEAKAMNKAEGKRAYQSVESMDKNSFDKTWAKFKADTKKAFGGKYAKGGGVDLDAISNNPPYAVAIDTYGEGDPDDIFVGFYKDNKKYGGGKSYVGRGSDKNVRWSMKDVFNDGYEPNIFQTIEDYRAWVKGGKKMPKGKVSLSFAKGGKLSTGDRYALELAGLTGVRQSAVEKLVKDNNLSEDELLNIIVGVGRQQIKSELVVSAVIDGAKSKSNTELVKFAKSEKAMKLAKGGSINNYDWKSKPLTLRTSDWQKKINYPRYHKFNGKTYNLIYNFNSKAEALRKIKDIGMTDTILQPIKYSDGKGGGLPKYFVYVSTDSADQYANGGGVGESDDCPEYFLEVEGDTQKAYELLKKGRWFDETSTRVYNDLEDIKGFVSNDKESLSRAETYLDSKGISTSVIYNLKEKFWADLDEESTGDQNWVWNTMYFAIQDRIDPEDGNDTMDIVEDANENALNSGLIYHIEELGKRPIYKEIAETALKNIRKFWGENIKEIYLSKIPKYIKSEMPKEPTLADAERIADKGAAIFYGEFEKKFKEYLNLMEGGFAKGYAKGGGIENYEHKRIKDFKDFNISLEKTRQIAKETADNFNNNLDKETWLEKGSKFSVNQDTMEEGSFDLDITLKDGYVDKYDGGTYEIAKNGDVVNIARMDSPIAYNYIVKRTYAKGGTTNEPYEGYEEDRKEMEEEMDMYIEENDFMSKGGGVDSEDWLFISSSPTATIYSDKTKEEYGDYKEIARVYNNTKQDWKGAKFTNYTLEIYSDNKKYKPLIARLEKKNGKGIIKMASGGKIFNLDPVDGRKSFYGKAKGINLGNTTQLQSYDTIVAEYDNVNKKMTINDYYSPTTARHINSFLDYYGYPTMSKSEMLAVKGTKFAKGGMISSNYFSGMLSFLNY